MALDYPGRFQARVAARIVEARRGHRKAPRHFLVRGLILQDLVEFALPGEASAGHIAHHAERPSAVPRGRLERGLPILQLARDRPGVFRDHQALRLQVASQRRSPARQPGEYLLVNASLRGEDADAARVQTTPD